jgi:hypothetical protein
MANIATALQQLTNQFSNQIEDYKRTMQGGKRAKPKATKPRLHEELQQQQLQLQQQQLQQFQNLAGYVKVYTCPKQFNFIINKHGKKVYIDRKGLKNDIPYNKKVVKRKAPKTAK